MKRIANNTESKMEMYGGSPMPLEGPRGLSQASQSRERTKLLSVQFPSSIVVLCSLSQIP